jgi:opacity protein-like surface antigen
MIRINNLFTITAVLLLGFAGISYAQEPDTKQNFKSPKFIFELSGSYNIPTGSAKGELGEFFKFENYGIAYGLGFHINIKYSANKKGTLYPYIVLGITQLQNDDNEKSYIDSNTISGGYPLRGSETFNSTPGTSLLIIRSIYTGAGFQYVFNSKSRLIPFAGAELTYSSIWGYYVQNPRLIAGNNQLGQTTFDINSTSRFGFGLNAGADYRISNHLGFVMGLKYRFENLLGKKSEISIEKNTMNLLDKSSVNLNSNLNKSRNIEYLEFYLGFTFFQE